MGEIVASDWLKGIWSLDHSLVEEVFMFSL